MTDYKAIHGKNIQHLASDLGAEGEGQIWFNTTSGDFKTIVKVAGAWASGNDINSTRSGSFGGVGTQTAGLIIAGDTPGGDDEVESYDGTNWSETTDINTARKDNAALGTQTAALTVGGDPLSGLTEEWNGTSWTEVGDLSTGRFALPGTGTTTAGLVACGRVPAYTGKTETFDGSSWTETGDLSTTRAYCGLVGSNTAALGFAGYRPAVTADSEEFDGSTWAEGNNVNTARWGIGSAGTQTAALGFGGQSTVHALTEQYDGTSWVEVGDLNTARNYCTNSIGSLSSALTAGGSLGPPGVSAATEEWDWSSTTTGPGAQNIKIITD